MKKFLKLVLWVTLFMVIINLLPDIGFSYGLLNYSKRYKYANWHHVLYDSINADLLILGSSRAWAQYDPHILDSSLLVQSYNLGVDGGGLERQLVTYKIYLCYQNKTPKYLIINFEYWGTWREEHPWGYQREQYFPLLLKPKARKLIEEKDGFYFNEFYIPMCRYYLYGFSSLIKDFREEDDIIEYKGYAGHEWKWDGKEFSKIESISFEPPQNLIEEFDCFLENSKLTGVNIVFVCSPIYIELTEKVNNLSEFYDLLHYYSEKYEIPVLDYIYDTLCYDTAYFYNATHLNKTGAELFTTKLCHDLDSLGILQN